MASAVDIDKLKGIVECSICLETYENPKILSCTHHFCKTCLDDVVTFTADGGGEITCPMRCPQKTILSKEETANNLLHCYDFKNLMEALKLSDTIAVQAPLCMCGADCTNSVSVYCNGTFMCRACYTSIGKTPSGSSNSNNNNNNNNSNLGNVKELIFDRKENKMHVFCARHVCACTYLCMDNTFLCKYCAHRDDIHKHHKMKLIEDEVVAIKKALSASTKLRQERSSLVEKETQATIDKGYDDLEAVLKARKTECMERCAEILDAEEKRLKGKYRSIAAKHMEQFSTEFFSGYNGSNSDVLDVQLVIEKEEILNEISSSNRWMRDELPYLETILLSENFGYSSETPLGTLNAEIKSANGEFSCTEQKVTSTLSCNSAINDRGAGVGGKQVIDKTCRTDGVGPTKHLPTPHSAIPVLHPNKKEQTRDLLSSMFPMFPTVVKPPITSQQAPSQSTSETCVDESTSLPFRKQKNVNPLVNPQNMSASALLSSMFDANKSASGACSSQVQTSATAEDGGMYSEEEPNNADVSNTKGKKKHKKKKKKKQNIILNPAWKINQTWLEISVDDIAYDRIVIDLYNEDTPNACSTFVQFLTAAGDCPLKYKGSSLKSTLGTGTGTMELQLDPSRTSMYVEKHEPLGKNKFEESHQKHNEVGRLTMLTDCHVGVFAIMCLADGVEYGRRKRVAFGQITSDTISTLSNIVSASMTDHTPNIVITNCGLI